VSGPAWLNVAANGALSGTPLSPDAGNNSFVLSVADAGGLSSTGAVNIFVSAAAPIISTISPQADGFLLSWSGGIAPYQVEAATNLSSPDWQIFAGPISSNSFSITGTNDVMFYRVGGQ
jgi:hypothetical protein